MKLYVAFIFYFSKKKNIYRLFIHIFVIQKIQKSISYYRPQLTGDLFNAKIDYFLKNLCALTKFWGASMTVQYFCLCAEMGEKHE